MDELQNSAMKPHMTDLEFRRETNDRLRRMETRLTRFMEWCGFDTEVRRPEFRDPARLDIPSDATSIRDCLAALPEGLRDRPVEIMHKGQHVVTIIPRQ